MIYLTLFWEFLQIGFFAFGGGLATIPFLFALGERHQWFTPEMLIDMFVVSEAAPGPFGIKLATYAGYTAAGIPGGLVAVAGLITPGLIVMLPVAKALSAFNGNPYVQNAFLGLRPAVMALIAVAGVQIAAFTLLPLSEDVGLTVDVQSVVSVLMLAGFVWASVRSKAGKKLSPLLMLGIAALVGVVFRL